MASGRSSRPGFVLALLVLSALTLVALADRVGGPAEKLRSIAADVVAPVRSVGARASSPFGDLFGSVTSYRRVKDENRRLREQLAAAQADQLRYADSVRERDEMLELAGFENPSRIPFVEARVIGHSPSNFDNAVEIDRGTSSGLRAGMPVVSGAGLVGRVRSVSRSRAVVSLITTAGNQVGVRLSTSGEVGLARTDRTGRITVDIIEPGTTIVKGEVLVTTGFENSRYPDRIVVGRVRSSSMKPGDLQVQVVMDPVVDPERLTFVKVLQWTEATGSLVSDAPPDDSDTSGNLPNGVNVPTSTTADPQGVPAGRSPTGTAAAPSTTAGG